MKAQIEFHEFMEIEKKLEIRVGKIVSIEDVPKSKKLMKLEVDFGTEIKIVVTNIKPLLDPEDGQIEANLRTSLGMSKSILHKNFAFVTNLKPVTMLGIESTAMILPGELESGSALPINGKAGTRLL